MRLARHTDYGLRVLLYLALHQDCRAQHESAHRAALAGEKVAPIAKGCM